jgi:Flp pilus assembly protein TadG
MIFGQRPRPDVRRPRKGAVIVEFALVVPFLALIAFGVIDFSRAYGQMNALNSALREGARYGSRAKSYPLGAYVTEVKAKVQSYATTYGFNGLDPNLVSVTSSGPPDYQIITVTVTNHPIALPILTNFLGVPALSLTRSVSFRWECVGLPAASCS